MSAVDDVVTKHNKLLTQLGCGIEILEWKNKKILLSNGIELTGDVEIRKFRNRITSPVSSGILSDIYAVANEQDRTNLHEIASRAYVSAQQQEKWKAKSESEKLQIVRNMRSVAAYTNADRLYQIPWNKGKTKDTDDRLLALSTMRSGAGNGMYGTTMSDDEKSKKSKLIKQRIQDGTWTPHVHNSRTHWECEFNGTKYRSSWECIYAALFPTDEYETCRIPYEYDDANFVYIVDFINHTTRVLTEIKPSSHRHDPKVLVKEKAACQWANDMGYEYRIISEDFFTQQYHNIPFDLIRIPNLRQKLAKIKPTEMIQ
jgi:hypothetical protein